MADHKQAMILATAAWTQLHAVTQLYQAAILRGDLAEAGRLRHEAHDLLDSKLDLDGEAVTAARALLGG